MSSLQCRLLLHSAQFSLLTSLPARPMARAWRTQNTLVFYTTLGVNIFLILKVTEDLWPREVVKGLPGIEDSPFLFVSKLLWHSRSSIPGLWIMNSWFINLDRKEREEQSKSRIHILDIYLKHLTCLKRESSIFKLGRVRTLFEYSNIVTGKEQYLEWNFFFYSYFSRQFWFLAFFY